MNVIWKQKLELKSTQTIQTPLHAQFLDTKIQDGNICIWYHCNAELGLEEREILIFGTGQNLVPDSDEIDYLGTVISGGYVWHVFEKVN